MSMKPAGVLAMKLLSLAISSLMLFMGVAYVLALASIRQHGRYPFWQYSVVPVLLVGLFTARRWISRQLRLRQRRAAARS